MNNKYKTSNLLSNIPLIFEKNIGQHDKKAKFVLRQNGFTTFFTENEVVLVLMKEKEREDTSDIINDSIIRNHKRLESKEYQLNVLRISLENSNQEPEIVGESEFKCKINYLIGSSKYEWTTDIPIYEKVLYKNIYPGIDLLYYGNQGRLEYDFIVSLGSDISNIKINFEGADNIELDEVGNILISIKESTVQMLKPRVYQEVDNKLVDIKSNFVIENINSVSFKVGHYDENTTLIIDPQLMYGSYLGGTGSDYGYGVAVDDNENAYITGRTSSTIGFPITSNAYQSIEQGGGDAFLIKINTKAATGVDSLLYGTYLGGDGGNDFGTSVAVDASENAYITGSTDSKTGFPITSNAYQSTNPGPSDPTTTDSFLIKINTKASTGEESLLYGTYLGGDMRIYGSSVAVDKNENAYITGETDSSNFPITSNAYQSTKQAEDDPTATDSFLIKINTNADTGPESLLYGTYLGGKGYDSGYGVAVDANENVYITGYTNSTIGFPITNNAYQSTLQGSFDTFLIKINTNASTGPESLLYGTYLGGTGYDYGRGVASDKNENAYITGYTSSTIGFPITNNAYQSTNQGGNNAFLIKINTKATIGAESLLYGTYLGGNNYGIGYSVAVDKNENAYITGRTDSTIGFPITSNAYQSINQGGSHAFLIKINTKAVTGALSLLYGTYLGGNGSDQGKGIAVDSKENAYIAGDTNSTVGFPITSNAYQSTKQGEQDTFLIKVNTSLMILDKSVSRDYSETSSILTYTITVNNNGYHTLNNINFIDTIPNNTTMIPNSLIIDGTTISGTTNFPGITIPHIGMGATSTVQFSVMIGTTIPSSNYITNIATAIYTSTIDSSVFSYDSNIVSTTILNANLNNTYLNSDKLYVTCDEIVTYYVSLYNSGSTTAQNIAIMDTIPNGVTFIPDSVIIDGAVALGKNPFLGMTIPNIGAGSISTVSFKVKIGC